MIYKMYRDYRGVICKLYRDFTGLIHELCGENVGITQGLYRDCIEVSFLRITWGLNRARYRGDRQQN